MTVDDWKWYDYYEFYVRMVVVVEEDAWSWLSLLWNEDPSSSFVATGIILWSVGIYILVYELYYIYNKYTNLFSMMIIIIIIMIDDAVE